jgi:hypothetical protein
MDWLARKEQYSSTISISKNNGCKPALLSRIEQRMGQKRMGQFLSTMGQKNGTKEWDKKNGTILINNGTILCNNGTKRAMLFF